jgi:hypothetical protein
VSGGEDVEFNIVANDKSGPAVRGAGDGLDRFGDKASKAAKKVDELGDQTGQLAKKLLEARAAALLLAKQFDATGDSKLLKDFQRANAEAGKLGRVLKTLKIDAPEIKNPQGFLGTLTKLGREAGIISSKAIIEGAGDLWEALPGKLKAGLIAGAIGAGVIFAPEISGAIQGGILAGVGAGLIGATVLIAAQNEKVQQEYSVLGERIMLRLKDAGKPMEQQLLASAPKLSAAFDRELPIIQRIMARAAADFGPIVDDVIAAVHEILPSLERAGAVGGDILANVLSQLPALTGAVGNLLDAFADGGRGGAAGLSLLVGEISGFINLMALLVRSSSAGLEFFGRFAEFLNLVPQSGGALTTLATAQERAAAAAGVSASSYDKLSQSLGNTANMAKQLQSNFDALFGSQMSVDQANLAVNVGMSQLTDTIKNNKKSLDQSTESGQQNVQAILNQVQALNAKREADIAAGNGTAEATAQANAAYAGNVQALRQVLINMGLLPAAVDALIAKYSEIPKNISTTVTTVYRTVGAGSTISDQATGHSQNPRGDTSAFSSWAPARYAAAQRAEMRAGGSGGNSSVGGPTEVHSEVSVSVLLDGEVIQPRINRTVKAARQRDAWRAKVGRR